MVGETCDDNEANFYQSPQPESPANAQPYQLFFPPP